MAAKAAKAAVTLHMLSMLSSFYCCSRAALCAGTPSHESASKSLAASMQVQPSCQQPLPMTASLQLQQPTLAANSPQPSLQLTLICLLDAEAAAGYYIFTTWLVVALGIMATGVRASSELSRLVNPLSRVDRPPVTPPDPILSDALAMATVSATFSHWTRQIGVQNIAPVYQPTSLFGLNGVRTTKADK